MKSILAIDYNRNMVQDPKVQRLGTPEDLSCRLLESRTPGGSELISTIDWEMTHGIKRENLQ